VTRRSPAVRFGLLVAAGALLIFALFPAYWMVSTAFDAKAGSRGAQLLPQTLTIGNFKRVIDDGGFGRYLRNSLLVAVITVLASALVTLLASVAVARFRFRFRTSVVVIILIVQMVPLEALVIPLFLQVRQYHALNSLLALSIVYLAFSLPFGIWMMRGFVAAVPKEIEEAAYVDGAGWWRMFFSILLPLVAPGLVATRTSSSSRSPSCPTTASTPPPSGCRSSSGRTPPIGDPSWRRPPCSACRWSSSSPWCSGGWRRA